MAWTFNSSAANGLPAITPGNSQTIGTGVTSATGNAISADVQSLVAKRIEFSPPSGGWTASRTSGLAFRYVTWTWVIMCADETNLNLVEAAIETYINDGRDYYLSDGTRTSGYAILDADGSGRVGPRQRATSGRQRQVWRLRFKVLRPEYGAAVL